MTRTSVAVDFNDLKTGFQSGKTAALSDWSFRKEQAEFAKVVNRLRVKNWQRKNVEKHRAKAVRHYYQPGVAARQIAHQKQKALAAYRAAAPVLVCAECHVEFCTTTKKGAAKRKYCSTACMQRERYQRITPGARRIKRTGGQP